MRACSQKWFIEITFVWDVSMFCVCVCVHARVCACTHVCVCVCACASHEGINN